MLSGAASLLRNSVQCLCGACPYILIAVNETLGVLVWSAEELVCASTKEWKTLLFSVSLWCHNLRMYSLVKLGCNSLKKRVSLWFCENTLRVYVISNEHVIYPCRGLELRRSVLVVLHRCLAHCGTNWGGSWTVWYAKSTFNSVPRAVLTREVLGGTNKQIVQ